MSKYKVGDKLICTEGGAISDAGFGWEPGLVFTVTNTVEVMGDTCYFGANNNHGVWEKYVKLYKENEMRTLQEMRRFDITTDENGGFPSVVYSVLKDGFVHYPEDSGCLSYITYKEAEERGWKIKQDEPSPKKLTVAEVAEKLGYKVEIVE